MSPRKVIERWVELFNQHDAIGLSQLYHEDAVNHQVVFEPVTGRQQIQAMFEQEFERAEMVCLVEQILEDGDWAILEWKDPLGLRGCGFFQVNNGKIKYQRGYWDQLTFLRAQNLPLPTE